MFDQKILNKLYQFCYSLTLIESDAYDLLQNSLEKFIKNQTKKENDLAFMYRIIRHQFIDDYRKNSRQQTIPFNEQEHIDFDVKTLESITIDEDFIEQLMAYLNPLEREILFYWAVEGYSTQQIAQMLGMPKGTVLSKIYRMRQRIKQQFSDESAQTSSSSTGVITK